MPDLPFMPMNWSRFFSDGKVATLSIEAQGVYALLLGRMWLNEGWLCADDRVIAKQIGIDIRAWRRTYRPLIEPLLRRDIDPYIGPIYTQKYLTEVRISALDLKQTRAASTARARAAKAAKSRRTPSVTEPKTAPVIEPVIAPVTETAAGVKPQPQKEEALPLKKAESFFPPTTQGLGAPSGEAAAAAPVASPSRKGGSLPPPTPALLRSKIVKGNGHGTAAQPDDDSDRNRGGQTPMLDAARAAKSDPPATGLFGALEAAIRAAKSDDDD